nr:immunoglobulin heavy chain junction region [Macaca mulatta]
CTKEDTTWADFDSW